MTTKYQGYVDEIAKLKAENERLKLVIDHCKATDSENDDLKAERNAFQTQAGARKRECFDLKAKLAETERMCKAAVVQADEFKEGWEELKAKLAKAENALDVWSKAERGVIISLNESLTEAKEKIAAVRAFSVEEMVNMMAQFNSEIQYANAIYGGYKQAAAAIRTALDRILGE